MPTALTVNSSFFFFVMWVANKRKKKKEKEKRWYFSKVETIESCQSYRFPHGHPRKQPIKGAKRQDRVCFGIVQYESVR